MSTGNTNLEPGQSVDHYTVESVLGHGGMSDVYRARDAANDREVTLKFPHQDMMGDPATYERFTREVKIGKLLDHPNIQKLYEMAGESFAPYLVLEYVPGRPLREILSRTKRESSEQRLPLDTAISIGIQIGKALEYAHSKQVFHRDLKPENIIVTPEGAAKVMDFGIAFMQGARRITWGPLSAQIGTPDYMAPEQIKGIRGDQRTDIYALGMILYECVTGRLPYDGDNALSVMSQHVNVSPPPLHRFHPEVPPALEEIILKAIRRNPVSRWPSMQALVDALENPEQVDVEALKAEREAEETADSSAADAGSTRSFFENEFGRPLWQVALLVIGSLVALVLLVVVAQLLHHGP